MSETNGKTPDFSIYGVWRFPTTSAICYYRLEVPLRHMMENNLAKTFLDTEMNPEIVAQATRGSDFVLTWRPTGPEGYQYAKLFKDMKPQYKDGKVLLPPQLVIDSDDAIDHVHPFNYLGYFGLGVRHFDGTLLKPGDTVYFTGPDGKKTAIWQDGKTKWQDGRTFDIQRNLDAIGYHYDAARTAAGVVVTNEELKKVYVDDQGCEPDRVYVFPNTIVPRDFQWPNLAPHDGIRLLWEGGASHMDSWWSIQRPLIQVLADNPDVKLVVLGEKLRPGMVNNISPTQLEYHPWVDYSAYKLKRSILDCDINLAPLIDQHFARCKSAIRWYEASMGPRPEATLAANVGPYKEIEDGETGLLYNTEEEFAEKLTSLIKNADLRKKVGFGAKKWVLTHRTPEKTVPGLAAFYKELKSRAYHEALKV